MKFEPKPVGDQVVVIVGASSGIGRATALLANQRGARVVAAARGAEALDTLRAEAASPERMEVMTADAADPDAMQALAARAIELHGRIDSWLHVAGVAEHARFEDVPPHEFRQVIDVDLLGPVWGARAALPHLRSGGGALVVVSSEIAKRGFPLLTSYSAAKHGVDGFLESLRIELQHDHAPVSVTQILPAAIRTPFFEHARTRLGVRPSGPPPVYAPEDVAEAILRATEHPRRDVVVGAMGKVQLVAQRVSPKAMDVFTKATAFRLQRSAEPKSPDDPDALEAPVEGDDRIHGVVTSTHR